MFKFRVKQFSSVIVLILAPKFSCSKLSVFICIILLSQVFEMQEFTNWSSALRRKNGKSRKAIKSHGAKCDYVLKDRDQTKYLAHSSVNPVNQRAFSIEVFPLLNKAAFI